MAAGVAACFGWMVWMVAGIGSHGFRVLTFAAGNSKHVFFSLILAICIKCLIIFSKCLIVHDLIFCLTKATHLNLIFCASPASEKILAISKTLH